MSDETATQESFLTQLSASVWVLVLVAAVSLARLVMYATESAAVQVSHLVWLAACVLSGCFAVGGFLFVAIKRTEARLAQLSTPSPAATARTTST